MSLISKPEVSKAITWLYVGLIVFVAAVGVFLVYAGFSTPLGVMGIVASIIVAVVEAILILILRSLYETRYILTDEELLIKTTKLIGGEKRIPLDMVESVEKTFIPFGIRLFGASFHGGYYKIPGLGTAFLAITNFDDGLLIKTKHRNYIITPRASVDFKEALELKIRS